MLEFWPTSCRFSTSDWLVPECEVKMMIIKHCFGTRVHLMCTEFDKLKSHVENFVLTWDVFQRCRHHTCVENTGWLGGRLRRGWDLIFWILWNGYDFPTLDGSEGESYKDFLNIYDECDSPPLTVRLRSKSKSKSKPVASSQTMRTYVDRWWLDAMIRRSK